MSSKTVIFNGVQDTVDVTDLQQDTFDLYTSNGDCIQLTKQQNGRFIATNGMNGYGENIKGEVYGLYLIICEDE